LDGLLITGRATSPSYLLVQDGLATICDAAPLWRKDTYETNAILKKIHGEGRAGVICIGPAGENLVKYANVNNNQGDFVGRTGMGAVMGSKSLKAVVALGTRKVPIHDPALYNSIRRAALEQIKTSTPAASLRAMGTNASMDLGMMTGDVPIKNWSLGEDFELSAQLGGPAMTQRYLVKPAACLYCPIACRRVMKNSARPYAMEEGPGPEYETCCSLGTNLCNKDPDALLKANELANKLGMDTITLGGTIAFAMDCFEKGILTKRDTGGIRLVFGEMDSVFEVMEIIAWRRGFGDLLAEGSRAAAARIGRGAEELTVQVKGLELPYHDPHGWHGLGLAYMMSARGACHLQHLVHPIEQGIACYEGLGLEENYQGQQSAGKGKMVRIAEDFGTPCNAMLICEFVAWCLKSGDFPAVLSAATGFSYDLNSYLRAGARIWLLKRGLNNLMGVTSQDDILPPKILTPYREGAAAGSVPDQDLLRAEYYAARGLETDGKPSPATLDAAGGLEEIKRLLHGDATATGRSFA
jgi:aldehyde:ferredoxin oxidoreductase